MKSCCCTGHRPKGFPFEYGIDEQKHNAYLKALEKKIKLAITKYGITNFISGMALGADMDFAEIVLKLREKYPITLECAIPCPNQTLYWGEEDKLRYEYILERADKITLISEQYNPDCMFKRNHYMVNKSELVIAVFNGVENGGTWYTLNYAKSCNKIIELIELCKLKNIKKNLILVGASVFVTLIVIGYCWVYSVQGDNFWNYFKEYFYWYINL